MALLWIDGFEGYGTSGNPSALTARYAAAAAQTNWTIYSGRLSGYSLGSNSGDLTATTPALTTDSTLIAGCALYCLNNTVASGTSFSIQFYDGATSGININLRSFTPNSTLTIKLGATTITTYTNFLLLLNVWYYIELKVFCHPTSGTVEVRVNGTTLVSLTGINTRAGTHNYHNTVVLEQYRCYWDDYYICDGSGAALNDFLGTIAVIGLFPNSDTATEQWIPSAGTTHYNLVDENPPNAATDYVSSSTQAQMDLWLYPSLAGTGTILGLQVNTQVAMPSGTSIILESPIVSNGSTDLGPDYTISSASYADTRHVSTTDPYTGLPWTVAGLAAAQIGIKIM